MLEVIVPLRLTLRSIKAGLPKPGEAARIPLVEMVSRESQEMLLDPGVIRLDDADVELPIPRAPTSCRIGRGVQLDCELLG